MSRPSTRRCAVAFISTAIDEIDFDERVLSPVGMTEPDELFVFLTSRGEFAP